MSTPFKLTVRARGKEGALHVSLGAIVVTITGLFAVIPAAQGAPLPWYLNTFLAVVGGAGICLLVKALIDIRNAQEWELRVGDDRMIWLSRNCRKEMVEGEVPICDIQSLVFRTSDGTPGEYIEIEFTDGSVKELPLVGLPSKTTLRAFIEYWRNAHRDIPIRNLEKDFPQS